MDFSDYQGIYVVAETRNGKVCDITAELIGQARCLADQKKQKAIVLLAGRNVAGEAERLTALGADEVYIFESPLFDHYDGQAYERVLGSFLCERKADTILVGATAAGRDLAPRLSAQLVCGVTADVTELSAESDTGLVIWSRPAMGDHIMADIVSPRFRPQMGTVRPGVFPMPEEDKSRQGRVFRMPVHLTAADMGTVLKRIIPGEKESDPLEEARIVVAGGRGIRSRDEWQGLYRLAALLHGSVGATRPICEMGWEPHSRQIGQTGKLIAPAVYFAFGISGAMQHICGVQADIMIAVNQDPQAPIFQTADYAVVADVKEFLPLFIEAVESLKKRHASQVSVCRL